MKAKRISEAKETEERAEASSSPESLTSHEKTLLKACVKRARKEGAALEEAILQRLREGLWRAMSGDFTPENAKAWFGAIIAARRLALLQRRSDADERAKKETERAKQKRIKRFFGIKQYTSK